MCAAEREEERESAGAHSAAAAVALGFPSFWLSERETTVTATASQYQEKGGREEAPNTGEVSGGLERAAGWLAGAAAAAAERPTALPFPPEAFQATLDDTVDRRTDGRAGKRMAGVRKEELRRSSAVQR